MPNTRVKTQAWTLNKSDKTAGRKLKQQTENGRQTATKQGKGIAENFVSALCFSWFALSLKPQS